jgi:hypothetical protein
VCFDNLLSCYAGLLFLVEEGGMALLHCWHPVYIHNPGVLGMRAGMRAKPSACGLLTFSFKMCK